MQKEAEEPSGYRGAGHCPDQASHGWCGLRERGGDTVRENSRERRGLVALGREYVFTDAIVSCPPIELCLAGGCLGC